MWKSCIFSEKFYNNLAGRYRVGIDGNAREFTLETSPRRLIQFYLSFIPLCMTLFGCILRALDPPLAKENPIQVLIITFGEAAVTVACIGLNIVVVLFGDGLVDLMNHSYVLLNDTCKNTNSKRYIQTKKISALSVYIRGKSSRKQLQ